MITADIYSHRDALIRALRHKTPAHALPAFDALLEQLLAGNQLCWAELEEKVTSGRCSDMLRVLYNTLRSVEKLERGY